MYILLFIYIMYIFCILIFKYVCTNAVLVVYIQCSNEPPTFKLVREWTRLVSAWSAAAAAGAAAGPRSPPTPVPRMRTLTPSRLQVMIVSRTRIQPCVNMNIDLRKTRVQVSCIHCTPVFRNLHLNGAWYDNKIGLLYLFIHFIFYHPLYYF